MILYNNLLLYSRVKNIFWATFCSRIKPINGQSYNKVHKQLFDFSCSKFSITLKKKKPYIIVNLKIQITHSVICIFGDRILSDFVAILTLENRS